MAQKVTKKVTKKRVKKNVERGQAHIQSSFNNTIVTLTDAEGNALIMGICRWTRIQRILRSLLLMQHRWQLRQQQRLH